MTALETAMHNRLRGSIKMMREGYFYPGLPLAEQMSYFALMLIGMGIAYGHGGRYKMGSEHDEPATWSRAGQDGGPALECAGFVEMLMYAMDKIDSDIFNYRGLRPVEHGTEFYRQAAGKEEDYKENWIPDYGTTITELNDIGVWAQTPLLLFYRKEFVPIAGDVWPKAGDCLFFASKDTRGWHFHTGGWVETPSKQGLVHSSPASKWDAKDGPKYTDHDSDYWKDFLAPQRRIWLEQFGASTTRLKELA